MSWRRPCTLCTVRLNLHSTARDGIQQHVTHQGVRGVIVQGNRGRDAAMRVAGRKPEAEPSCCGRVRGAALLTSPRRHRRLPCQGAAQMSGVCSADALAADLGEGQSQTSNVCERVGHVAESLWVWWPERGGVVRTVFAWSTCAPRTPQPSFPSLAFGKQWQVPMEHGHGRYIQRTGGFRSHSCVIERRLLGL